jgi:hypothetical protein
MRVMLAVAVVAMVVLAGQRPGRAYDGPWCAVTNTGGGTVQWNCSLPTFEMCRQEVIAGNRGFCNPNPRWVGDQPRARRSSRRAY